LQKNFSCNIQIDHTSDPMIVTVTGQPGHVESAAVALYEIITASKLYLGSSSIGAMIGYGGEPAPTKVRSYEILA